MHGPATSAQQTNAAIVNSLHQLHQAVTKVTHDKLTNVTHDKLTKVPHDKLTKVTHDCLFTDAHY